MGHERDHGGRDLVAGGNRRKIALVLTVTVAVLVAEVVGAAWTSSLALLADAGHMLTDAACLALAPRGPASVDMAAWSTSTRCSSTPSRERARASWLAAEVVGSVETRAPRSALGHRSRATQPPSPRHLAGASLTARRPTLSAAAPDTLDEAAWEGCRQAAHHPVGELPRAGQLGQPLEQVPVLRGASSRRRR